MFHRYSSLCWASMAPGTAKWDLLLRRTQDHSLDEPCRPSICDASIDNPTTHDQNHDPGNRVNRGNHRCLLMRNCQVHYAELHKRLVSTIWFLVSPFFRISRAAASRCCDTPCVAFVRTMTREPSRALEDPTWACGMQLCQTTPRSVI